MSEAASIVESNFQPVKARKGKLKDLTGLKFSKLRVFSLSPYRKPRKPTVPLWNCICDCGTPTLVRGEYLRYGHTKSCGCDCPRRTAESHYIHGMSASSEHGIWRQMFNRCYNENIKSYQYYGAKGVSICERWRNGDGLINGFQCFYADMGPRPSRDYSVDRIDVTGNYSPENCRWATRKEQSRNKRNNKKFTWNGQTLCLMEICEMEGVDYELVNGRLLSNRGWSVKDAVLRPVNTSRNGRNSHVNIYA